MNYLDAVLAIPLLLGLYKGVTRGIVKELSSLLALVLGIYGAVHFADISAPYLKEHLSIDSSFLKLASFAVTFVLIAMLVRLLGAMLNKVIKMVALGFVSRLLGAIFGVLKAAFVLSALLLIFNTADYYLELVPKKQKKESLLYAPISSLVPSIVPEAKDGSSLLKEAQKAMEEVEKEAEDIISL